MAKKFGGSKKKSYLCTRNREVTEPAGTRRLSESIESLSA